MLLQEELSISVARECLAKDSGLEPEFVALHRKHMADEVDHVQWDIKLVERVWLPLPMWKRRRQARVFGAMIGGYSLLTAGTEIADDEATRAFLTSPPFSKWKNGRRSLSSS